MRVYTHTHTHTHCKHITNTLQTRGGVFMVTGERSWLGEARQARTCPPPTYCEHIANTWQRGGWGGGGHGHRKEELFGRSTTCSRARTHTHTHARTLCARGWREHASQDEPQIQETLAGAETRAHAFSTRALPASEFAVHADAHDMWASGAVVCRVGRRH